MDITKVERNNFRSSLLKQIIIRVDYANLSDLTGFVTYIKRVESFAACFVDCRTLNLNKVDLNEPVSIADKKYFPINSMQTETIFSPTSTSKSFFNKISVCFRPSFFSTC